MDRPFHTRARGTMATTVAALGALLLHPAEAAAQSPDAERHMMVAHLGREDGDAAGLERIRTAFRAANPGCDVRFAPATRAIGPARHPRVVFVQRGAATATVHPPAIGSTVDVGDLVLLPAGRELRADADLDLVLFTVNDPLPAELPPFIRPDWDERITDTPGGCATETGAYRRILLTWQEANGPYIYHGLNAHRVRITDSFSHYHPLAGGFDEFYLVQMVQPGARIIVSSRVDLIESPTSVTAEQAADLLRSHELQVGDLVYLPRGVMHRGVDGVLAQVIAVPGFRPGAEIGVDEHLRALNEHPGLDGDSALPCHGCP
ncbi:MAG: hypothetical protein ACYTGC_10605 [Planctomycetota bacterium]|jgi:hypothetical protein